jgi:hypothetical protein
VVLGVVSWKMEAAFGFKSQDIIVNKYVWLFLWIRFEDSLRLFTKSGID